MSSTEPDRRRLNLLDATSIMLGIVIGSGIFQIPADVAQYAASAPLLLSVWLAGGLASLMGALCFAELSTRYPEHGGAFAFLNRAYGSWAGMLFAWTDFWIVRPANACAVAIVLGSYANALVPLSYVGESGYAHGAVLLTTALHLGGLSLGRWSQNVMSLAKIAGLMFVVIAGLIAAPPAQPAPPIDVPTATSWGKAFILVMFCYGGWSDLGNVAAEVRDPAKNMVRSLVLGVVGITLTYLAVNGAAIAALGVGRLGRSTAFAAEIAGAWGSLGERFVSVLVIVCCLGSLSGVVFTGARVYYALGQRHAMFAWLRGWDTRRGTPTQSLLAQAAISCTLLAVAGSNEDGFERLIVFATPCYWAFMLLTSFAVIILRYRDADTALVYHVPCYPVLPLVFATICAFLVTSSVTYMARRQLSGEVWYTIIVVAVGLVLALVASRQRLRTAE
jgi:amino acid transporter